MCSVTVILALHLHNLCTIHQFSMNQIILHEHTLRMELAFECNSVAQFALQFTVALLWRRLPFYQ
nr:MAG TPA: hypothetical protein [Caudoviricetes sp.]